MKEESRTPIPDWLKNLQENSWELELLISGGAVFTLIQFPEIFIEWIRGIRTITDLPGSNMFLVTGITGIKILTNGFILHLFLRAFWLALVCINYVFPQGINSNRILKTGPFKSIHQTGDLRNQIMAVDRLCGMVIFMAILSTLILSQLVVILAIHIFLAWKTDIENPSRLLFIISKLVQFNFYALLIYTIDLLGMGWLRRLPVISWLLIPHFKLFDWLSLRFLIERALNMFSSNVRRWSFRLGAFLFGLTTILSMYFSIFNVMHWPNIFDSRKYFHQIAKGMELNTRYYQDESSGLDLYPIHIPSKIIQNNYLEVNFRYIKILDYFIEGAHLPANKRFLSSVTDLYIDDSLYQNIEWRLYRKKSTADARMATIISIEHLPNGLHYLHIKPKPFPFPEYQKLAKEYSFVLPIPFWKDVH